MDFLICYVGKFDMYVEDDYAAFVRYCFEDPLDAEIFRAGFEPKHGTESKLTKRYDLLKNTYHRSHYSPQDSLRLCRSETAK